MKDEEVKKLLEQLTNGYRVSSVKAEEVLKKILEYLKGKAMEEKELEMIREEDISHLDDEKVNALNEILLNTQEQCQMMDELIRNQIQVKDGLIDKLHKELNYYKQEEAERFVVQLMKALINVREKMKKQMNSEKWNELNADELRSKYTYSYEELTDLLQQQNVDPFESEPGERFDASKHQIHKAEPTDDESLDKTIKKSVSEGYVKGSKVLIAERVIVYKSK